MIVHYFQLNGINPPPFFDKLCPKNTLNPVFGIQLNRYDCPCTEILQIQSFFLYRKIWLLTNCNHTFFNIWYTVPKRSSRKKIYYFHLFQEQRILFLRQQMLDMERHQPATLPSQQQQHTQPPTTILTNNIPDSTANAH